MTRSHGYTPFIDTAAVEAWDAWFRWREQGELGDLTIDATWERVASALALAEPNKGRASCKHRLQRAFSSWQLLPDERILATAGTGAACWPADGLAAVLNMAAFVTAPCTQHASIDLAAIEEVADLAVRALDNAALLRGGAIRSDDRLHIGVIGLGDALALLDLSYDSAAARARAVHIARALAIGCAMGSIRLAKDRSATTRCDPSWIQHAQRRGMPYELVNDASLYGLRYTHLTSISSQRRLALLANCVADAIDPASYGSRAYVIAATDGERVVYSPGYAMSFIQQSDSRKSFSSYRPEVSVFAQRAMRSAMQMWIDGSITYHDHAPA